MRPIEDGHPKFPGSSGSSVRGGTGCVNEKNSLVSDLANDQGVVFLAALAFHLCYVSYTFKKNGLENGQHGDLGHRPNFFEGVDSK